MKNEDVYREKLESDAHIADRFLRLLLPLEVLKLCLE